MQSPFSQRPAGNTFIIGKDQTGLYGGGFKSMEEKRVKIYSKRKKSPQKSQGSQMQVAAWRKSLSLSFFPLLYSGGTEMTATRGSGRGSVEEESGACTSKTPVWSVSTPFSISLAQTRARAASYPPDKLPFLICVTIRADGPLFARGSLELLPFE